MKTRGQIGLSLLSLAWLIVVTAGLLWLADYDSKPGIPARSPQEWPARVSLARNSDKPTVLMFLHPRCPCSRASLYELARMAHGERDQLDILILLAQPAGVTADWMQTDLVEKALVNRDLRVVSDLGGLLAKQFGAQTSGQVLVYDRAGMLRFEGGITPGRGHAGDSFGQFIVRAIAAGQAPEVPVHWATFGCSLAAESQSNPKLEVSDFKSQISQISNSNIPDINSP